MRRILTLMIALLGFSLQLFAVKAYPYPVTVTQPDGSSLTIRLHGDENRSWATTLNGTPVCKGATVSGASRIRCPSRVYPWPRA